MHGFGFRKGKSGNPGGRPKLTEGEKHARNEAYHLANKATPAAIKRLIELMQCDGMIGIAACNSILDRALGKPTEHLEADINNNDSGQDISQLTDEELAKVLETKLAEVRKNLAIKAKVRVLPREIEAPSAIEGQIEPDEPLGQIKLDEPD